MGSASNANGQYMILNVPAGTYTLEASSVGFRRQSVSITVADGQTVTRNFSLTTDALNMSEVVTTGSYTPRTKQESTVSISTMTAAQLTLASPRSTTEALRYIPGFTRVESSGGEVNQNITMRGILGVEYVMFMEDGLPVFPTMHTFFMNADNLFRLDQNIDHVEVVRGGSSALFGSSTPGAIINLINKTGGPEIGGVLQATGGTEGLARYDFNINGPLEEDWRFNLGGFYRYDHGVRDPGFPGIRGGQVKASITRLLNNGYVRASFKGISDRNQFILPLPFQNPSDPDYVPGFSDYGSMNTLEGNHLRVPIPTGELEFPLDNGLMTQATWLTADIGLNFPGDWSIQNTAQTMANDQEWNAILPFNAQSTADFSSSLLVSPSNPRGFPVGSTFQYLYTNVLTPQGAKTPFDMASNNGLGLVAPGGEWHVEKPISAFQNQLIVTKRVGEQRFSAGVYFANYQQTNRWYFSDILTDVRDNPHFLDVVVTPPGGTPVQVTSNGFRRYLSNYVNGNGSTSIISGVIGAELQLTDRLRADLGARWESDSYTQTSENTSNVDLDGDTTTTYDVEPWGNGSFRHFSRTIKDWAGSIGLNYRLTDEFSVYAQGSRAFKMPALDEFLNAQAQSQIELFENRLTNFVEGGVKYASPLYGVTLNGFWGELKNNVGQGAEVDTLTGATIWRVRVDPNSRAYGVEAELSAQPIPGLMVMGAGTFLASKTVEPGGAALSAGGIPSVIANVAATYSLMGVTLKGDWHYVAKRDLIDANYSPATQTYTTYRTVGELPAYSYFNFGLSYAFPGQGITIAANLDNALQSKGLEEGNPRLISTGGNPIFLARPLLPRRFTAFITYQF